RTKITFRTTGSGRPGDTGRTLDSLVTCRSHSSRDVGRTLHTLRPGRARTSGRPGRSCAAGDAGRAGRTLHTFRTTDRPDVGPLRPVPDQTVAGPRAGWRPGGHRSVCDVHVPGDGIGRRR